MDVSAFRFAIETLEKDRWSILCLMDDDIEAARMAWTLVEMLPGEGVRIALIDPHLADKPERILWEHLKDLRTGTRVRTGSRPRSDLRDR